ncbi:MAG: recombination mediator RecR [Candidatus Magasanikbacteria bacterium]|nr:recombination mediator RecR [Candidatus Magasanikbacteria bacterium]
MYSPAIDKLILALKKLPGVGRQTAERYVFHFLKSGKKEVAELTLALKDLMTTTQSCQICWNFSDQNPCARCSQPKRNQAIICVVAEPQDLAVIEATQAHQGSYHVLRGLIDASDEESVLKTKIADLLARCQINTRIKISEVILALNPNLAGETTMLYLEKKLREQNLTLKITRLARGLPLGSDIRYADELTLLSAIKNRT